MISALLRFKKQYDRDASIAELFPDLAKAHPDDYADETLQSLCEKMHLKLHEKGDELSAVQLMSEIYETIPPQKMTPAEAYEKLVHGEVERVPIDDLQGRVAAAMVAPYPPGIPLLMPGEEVEGGTIVEYFKFCREFDKEFPGFENEIHGLIIEEDGDERKFYLDCIAQDAVG